MRNGGNIIMFSKVKKTAILIAASALLTTSLDGTVVFADTASNTTDDSALTKTNSDATADTSSTSTTTKTQAGYENIDLASVKLAMLNELNRLRSQNNLKPLTSVDILNNYAQARTDSFITSGGVDDHSNWHSANMYPYNYTAEENIAQMPFSMIGSTDPLIIAEKITDEFYSETYDSTPDFGHRKNMLNPYISYVGIGVSVSNTGMIYFSQEMGNNQESYSKYDPTDVKDYYMTKYNDYANPSKYDLADTDRKGADYTQRKDYVTADMRGGVTTKNYVTPVYDRYGNKNKDLELAPNSDWISDIVATINGKKYYHVSTNGFVSAADVLPWAKFLYGSSVTATTDAKVYDNNGNFTGKIVPKDSKWIMDRRAVNPKTKVKMYHIATNAWLQENQVNVN